jgi:hypothetical protein
MMRPDAKVEIVSVSQAGRLPNGGSISANMIRLPVSKPNPQIKPGTSSRDLLS